MSRLVLCLLLLLCTSFVHATESGEALARGAGRGLVGEPAPALVLQTLDGGTVDLGALYGHKAVYLKFWATWCTVCRAQMPHFKHVFAGAGNDLAVIAVDVGFDDTPQAVRAYRKEVGLHMPIVFDDGQLAQAFHLRVTPQSVVIGRDGRVLYVGHEADARLDAALKKARTMPAGAAARAAAQPPLRHYGVGDALPALDVATLDGRFHAPTGDGRPLALVFLSPWCESYLADSRPPLAQACRNVREQVQALAGDHRVRWLGIASGLWADASTLQQYRSKYDVHIPLALDADGTLFRRFGVMHVPTVVLVDAHGRISGHIEGNSEDLRQALGRLLAPTASVSKR